MTVAISPAEAVHRPCPDVLLRDVRAAHDLDLLVIMTVLYGLSIQARDGASADDLDAVVDLAMLAWDNLTR